ncbi:response regulator, partial [Halochromatium sp.]
AIPNYLVGDSLRLGQALLNLAGNAVKFTEHGLIQVRVRLLDCAADRVRLGFWGHDSGIGIAVEKLPQLYDPFWQADSSTTRRYGGSGLGLPITKQLISLMGGDIQVHGRARRGTSFSFQVELGTLSASAAAPLSQETEERPTPLIERDNRSLKGRRVLLVDDNALNLDLVSSLLSALGIVTEIALNGHEGVSKSKTGAFDLVLMDIQMPEMDGLEATRIIRRQEAETAPGAGRSPRLPIIALTAHASEQDRAASLAAGMDDHLTKPIDTDQLWKFLQHWLPQKTTTAADRSQRADSERTAARLEAQPALLDDAQAAERTGAATLLPEQLPPFDLPAALHRCNGNRDLLRKLILRFVQDYADTDKRLRDHLRAQAPEQAERLAHSLKSSAATLHLEDLADAARALEARLRQPAPPTSIEPLLAEVDRQLDAAVQPARQLPQHPTDTGDPSSSESQQRRAALATDGRQASAVAQESAPSTVPSAAHRMSWNRIARLHAQIKANSLSARDSLAELRPQLGAQLGSQLGDDLSEQQPEAQILAAVADALDALDYEQALSLVDDILRHQPSLALCGICDPIATRDNHS